MRVRLVALSSLVLGVALVGATATQANAAVPSHTGTPSPSASSGMPGMDMAGMDHHAAAPPSSAPGKKDPSDGIRRARLKPVFLAAKLDAKQEVQVPGKPPVGDPKGSATGIVRVQGDRVTFAFSWKGISAPTKGHIHQGAAGTNGDVKVTLFEPVKAAPATPAPGASATPPPPLRCRPPRPRPPVS